MKRLKKLERKSKFQKLTNDDWNIVLKKEKNQLVVQDDIRGNTDVSFCLKSATMSTC